MPCPAPPLCPALPCPTLQTWLFYTTGVCLPWISLIFGAVVLGLVQVQRLGAHPALIRVVQPVLTGLAVGATLLKLLLMRAAQQQQLQQQGQLPPAGGAEAGVGAGAAPDATSLPYASGEPAALRVPEMQAIAKWHVTHRHRGQRHACCCPS